MKKRLTYFIFAVLSIMLVFTAYFRVEAAAAVPWSFTNLTDGFITPTKINGVNQGIISAASSTIGNGTQQGGLTINGGATTTGGLYVVGTSTLATTTTSSINGTIIIDGTKWAQSSAGINGAIAASGSNTTYYIRNGTTTLTSAIDIRNLHNIQFICESHNAVLTIPQSSLSNFGFSFMFNANSVTSDITIKNCTFDGGYSYFVAPPANQGGGIALGLRYDVEYNLIKNFNYFGFWIGSGAINDKVFNNEFAGSGSGVDTLGGGGGQNIEIAYNTFDADLIGNIFDNVGGSYFYIHHNVNYSVHNIYIEAMKFIYVHDNQQLNGGNIVAQSDSGYAPPETTDSNNIFIYNNRLLYGGSITYSSNATTTATSTKEWAGNVQIDNNYIASSTSYGVLIQACGTQYTYGSNYQVNDNVIYDVNTSGSTSLNTGCGIFVPSGLNIGIGSNVTVSNNNIIDDRVTPLMQYGIEFGQTCCGGSGPIHVTSIGNQINGYVIARTFRADPTQTSDFNELSTDNFILSNAPLTISTTTATSTISYGLNTATSGGCLAVKGVCVVGGGLTIDPNWIVSGSPSFLTPTTTIGIGVFASSTIGNGSQNAGLTISGGSTTTGSGYIKGSLGIGDKAPSRLLTIQNEGAATTNGQYIYIEQSNSGFGWSINEDDLTTGNLFVKRVLSGVETTIATFTQKPALGIGIVPDPNTNLEVHAATDVNLGVRLGIVDTSAILLNAFNDSGATNEPLEFRASKYNFTQSTSGGGGKVGIGTSSAFAQLSIQTNPTDTVLNTTLFAIGSSTATATTTLFSVSNTGSTTLSSLFGACNTTSALTTDASGNITCGSISGSGASFAWPFTPINSTSVSTSSGLVITASSTIGNGSPTGGLTISGGATTTGTAYFAGKVNIGSLTQTQTGNPNQVFIKGPDNTNQLQVSNTTGNSSFAVYLATTGNCSGCETQFGSVTNTSLNFFTNNGTPSEKVATNGGFVIADPSDGQGTANITPNAGGLYVTGTVEIKGMNQQKVNLVGNLLVDNGKIAVGTSTPYALVSIVAASSTGSLAPTTLFTIASTTGGTATTTLFIVQNTGKVGIGTSSPTAALVSVAASSTVASSGITGMVAIIAGLENTVTMIFQAIDQWGHLITSGDTPVISACGTSTVSGNDRNGTITLAGVALTSCTMTFAHAYPTAPECTVSDNTTASTADVDTTASAATFGLSVGLNSGKLFYVCQGHQ